MPSPRNAFGLALALSLSVGTAACVPAVAHGPGASGYHPPPQRPGTVIQEWEHYCVSSNDQPDEALREAGKAGFEMVSGDSGYYCFKRPVIYAPAPISPAAAGS